MKYKDIHIRENESPLAKMVMDRIRKEEPWSFSQTNQLFHISYRAVRWLTALGILLLTLSLVLILAGLNGSIGAKAADHSYSSIHQITGVGDIGYADSNSTSLTVTIDDMVASIGDAFMISGYQGAKSLNFPLLISVFIFFEVLLLMNWITRHQE